MAYRMKTSCSACNGVPPCECSITPRCGSDGGCKDFVNQCIVCGGRGGSLGNVVHRSGCKHYCCGHILESHNTCSVWGHYEPDKRNRDKHTAFRKILLNEVSSELLRRNTRLYKKAMHVVGLKTGVWIDLFME